MSGSAPKVRAAFDENETGMGSNTTGRTTGTTITNARATSRRFAVAILLLALLATLFAPQVGAAAAPSSAVGRSPASAMGPEAAPMPAPAPTSMPAPAPARGASPAPGLPDVVDLADLDGWVSTWPAVLVPGEEPPTINLVAYEPLFVAGANVQVTAVDEDSPVTPHAIDLDVASPERASFTTSRLPRGTYELTVTSGEQVVEAEALEVRDLEADEEGWLAIGDTADGRVRAGTRELSVLASHAVLSTATRVGLAVRYDFETDEELDLTAGTTVEVVDAARAVVRLPQPIEESHELELQLTAGDVALTGYAWVPSPWIYLDTPVLLAGQTRGQTLRFTADLVDLEAARNVTVGLRIYGRSLPPSPLGRPRIDGDNLEVDVAVDLPLGSYETVVTVDGEPYYDHLEVAEPGVRQGRPVVVREEDGAPTWVDLEGIGQRWDAATTLALVDARGAVVAEVEDLEMWGRGVDQWLSGQVVVPTAATGLHALRIGQQGRATTELPVLVMGPKLDVMAWPEDGTTYLDISAAGFELPAQGTMDVVDRSGRVVVRDVAFVSDGWWAEAEIPRELRPATYTLRFSHGGRTYEGRFHADFPDLDLDLDHEQPRRITEVAWEAPGGDLGPVLLSLTSQDVAGYGRPIATPLPDRRSHDRGRQRWSSALQDGFYEYVVDDGHVTWYGSFMVGDPSDGPRIDLEPWLVPSGYRTPFELTLLGNEITFAGEVTATLYDEDFEEVAGAVGAVRIQDATTATVDLVRRLPDGEYPLEISINGGLLWAGLVIGDDDWPPGGPDDLAPPTCADAQPVRDFPDVDRRSTHGRNIVCSAGLGLVRGRDDGRFDPTGTLTRGQAASILVRALEASGVSLTAGRTGFADIAGSVHEEAIAKLAAEGIVQGRTTSRFDPSGAVTRAQLASLLDRASQELMVAYPRARSRFTDLAGSPHQGAIERLAGAEVILGRTPTTFAPSRDINRAQAASLFVRWLEDQARRVQAGTG